MSQELNQFVKESIDKGVNRKKIKDTLKKAGWKKDEINKALAQYIDTDYPIAVPKREAKISAKEAFLLLVVFTTLYITAINLGILLFQFINAGFPEVIRVSDGSYSPEAVRFAIASLVIAYPVYLFVSWLMTKVFETATERRNSPVYKWLTYITLFITAVIMIGDLITLVFNMLSGEFTIRFFLKVLVVLAIAGTVFWYYLNDLRKGEDESDTKESQHMSKTLAASVSIVMVAAVVIGMFFIGTPKEERARQIDQQRLSAIQSIASAIDTYWNANDALPETLAVMQKERDIFLPSLTDPVTGMTYQYIPGENGMYQLCAVFDLPSENQTSIRPGFDEFGRDSGFWQHDAGRHCYDIEVIEFETRF